MADNNCESQTFTNVPEGFVKLLSFIVQVAMGPSVRPVFTLYQHKVNDSLAMHQATVQFKGGRGELRRFGTWEEQCLRRGMLCRWQPARRYLASGMSFPR